MLSLLSAGTASAAPIATTTELTVPSSVAWGTVFDAVAWVSPAPAELGGTVTFTVRDQSLAIVMQETNALVEAGATFMEIRSLGRGQYTVSAEFSGIGDSQPSSDSGAFEILGEDTATELEIGTISGGTIVPGASFRLEAYLTPYQETSGTVAFYETTSGTDVLLGSASVGPHPSIQNLKRAVLDLEEATEGTHSYRADYQGTVRWNPSTDSASITVSKGISSVTFNASPATVEHPGVVNVGWAVAGVTTEFAMSGTVEIRNNSTSEVIATGGLTGTLQVPTEQVGALTLRATYSGDEHYLGVTKTKTVNVIADTAHAHKLAIQYTTFYPVVDTYRDTDKISGIRDEPISVQILIYNPGGTLVRKVSIARASGAYSWSWNGKNNSGVLLPAAKYRVVQKLTDARNNRLTSTHYITLSRKSVHYSTVTLEKLGNKPTADGKAGTGQVRYFTDGSARLTGGSFGWAGVGYQFHMPSGVIYKNMKLAVYGSGNQNTSGPTKLGAQDFTDCAYSSSSDWDDSCFTHLKSLSYSTAWTTASLAGKHRHRRYVRAAVSTYSSAIVFKVRLTVTVGVLQ
jgi:hypothetical protein